MEHFNPFKQKIQSLVKKALPSDCQTMDITRFISEPPNLEMGHYALGCFFLAGALKKSPAAIATELSENLNSDTFFIEIKAKGPYLNFKLSPLALKNELFPSLLDESFFKRKLINCPQKTMVEYSQPNTHKILHVGHMRNLCLGDAVVRLMKFAGDDVIRCTYPGDVGTHVAKCLWYLKKESLTPPEGSDEIKGEWLGKIYALANERLEKEKGTEKEQKNRTELTEILKQLEKDEGEYFKDWKKTRQWSLKLMQKAYEWAGVNFDRWFFESEVDSASVKYIYELFNQGLLIKDKGALGMDLSDDKLGFCLLLKTDGTGLYATKDVQLAKKKFEEFGIEKSIYVVDNRQARHFSQVFKVLEKLGIKQAKNCYHLQYDVVELPDGPMSSRKGNIIPLMELISKMESKIIGDYLEKYRGDWSDQEIQETARKISAAAIKYGMTRMDNNRKIIFNMDEWLSLEGETGPYLQYVCARIKSILDKSETVNLLDVNFDELTHKYELSLAVKLSYFNDIVLTSAEGMKTSLLCSYLSQIGKLFNAFYAECPIMKAETENLKNARLILAESVHKTLKQGLDLLGIETPKRM